MRLRHTAISHHPRKLQMGMLMLIRHKYICIETSLQTVRKASWNSWGRDVDTVKSVHWKPLDRPWLILGNPEYDRVWSWWYKSIQRIFMGSKSYHQEASGAGNSNHE